MRSCPILVRFVVALLALAVPAGAYAQETPVALVISPQVWFSHIPEAPGREVSIEQNSFWFPQWGGQVALNYGRWSFGVGVLSVSYDQTEKEGGGFRDLRRTDRTDIDFAVTYSFLDVVKDTLDVSLGLGFKYVDVSGTYTVKSPPGALFTTGTVHERFEETIYGVTFPVGFNFHLSKNLFLPIGATVMVGNDRFEDRFSGVEETTAFGATVDVGLRYFFANGASLYGGYRWQGTLNGQDYQAQGPVLGMSVPFDLTGR